MSVAARLRQATQGWPIPVAAASVGLLAGAGLGLGIWLIAPFVVALIVAAFFMVKPKWLLWVSLFGGLAGVGLIDLFVYGLHQASWAFSLSAICVGAIGLAQEAMTPTKGAERPDHSLHLACLMLVMVVLASVAMSPLGLGVAASGVKGYLPALGIAFGVLWVVRTGAPLNKFMNGLMALTIVQLPFVLYEFFALVPLRSSQAYAERNVVAIDIVAGTFGGVVHGGGRSPDMAVLCLAGLTCGLCTLRYQLPHRRLAWGAVLSALLCMALSEVKMVFVLLPIAIWIIYGDLTRSRPLQFAGIVLGGLLVVVLIFVGYSMLPGAKSQRAKSLDDYFNSAVGYNFGDAGYGSAELNRVSVYKFWFANTASRGEMARTLIGFGPGATGTSAGQHTLATHRFKGVGISLTGASALLWEIGLLGAGAVAYIFVVTFRRLKQLARSHCQGRELLFLQTMRVALIALAFSVFHNNYIVFDLPFQTLWMLAVGLVFATDRKV